MATGRNRQERLTAAANKHWDLIVVGGGITGAGVAREAARVGLSVLLLEQKDYAWGTSSRSSKMVHGGLRYLASGNVGLTRHSVQEREALLHEAQGLVEVLPYVWPHYKGAFPSPLAFDVLLRLYDAFSGKSYRQYHDPSATSWISPYLKQTDLIGVTQFADAVTDDVRLVLRVLAEVVRSAHSDIFNYIKVTRCDTAQGHVVAEDKVEGGSYKFSAEVIVNATGAWADQLRPGDRKPQIRPCRGSHITFPLWQLPVFSSVTLHHPRDGRALFIYPWESVAVVGTTDIDQPQLDDSETSITQVEVDYLLEAANHMFPALNLKEENILSSWAGVRPIVSSGGALKPSAEKRDHSIWVDQRLVTVSGGKLTTFRLIALDVMKKIKDILPRVMPIQRGPLFTQSDMSIDDPLFDRLLPSVRRRLLGFYGDQVESMLLASQEGDLDEVPGTRTLWIELRWSALHESVVHLDDLLLRRVRIGLLLPNGGVQYYDQIRNIMQKTVGWSDEHWQEEWERYITIWKQFYALPREHSTFSPMKQGEESFPKAPLES